MKYSGKINFIQGEFQGSSIDLQSGIQQILGRNGADCNIFFQSDRVSRVHCAIIFDENTGKLNLLNYSTSGTTVNGKELAPQQSVALDNGAKVKLGHSDNVFIFSSQVIVNEINTTKKEGLIKKVGKAFTVRPDSGATIFENFWVEDDEKEVMTFGNDRVINYFTGKGLLKNRVVLTNKRLYINEHAGIISHSFSRHIVDVDDITETSITKRNPIWSLVMAGIWLVLGLAFTLILDISVILLYSLIPCVIQLLIYLKAWGCFFVVNFPGGNIKFSLKNYSLYEMTELQRAICAIKRRDMKYYDV
ncbi:MAG: FHA domain-containing protein [Coprococcus sp.]|nr:FHA domain-containing protein [Coprococcus sp.]